MSKERKSRWWLWLGGAAVGALALVVVAVALLARFLPNAGSYAPLGKKIGVLEIRGPIVNTEKHIEVLHAYRDDPTVAAVVLYINSPGGSAAASQELYDEVLALRKKDKKVYAYISDVGASGAYYIACGADKIYASPGSLVGSIGVIMTFTNVEGLFGKIGLTTKTIKTGTFKDIGSPYRAMTPEEEKLLGATLGDVYQQFLDAVVEGRRGAVAARLRRPGEPAPTKYAVRRYVASYADGRIFSGRQARALGFVDENGNFQKCVNELSAAIGVKGKAAPLVRRRIKTPTVWDALSGRARVVLFGVPEPASRLELKYSLY